MNKYNELVDELNFYDGSVGIYPPENIKGALDILDEFNISPIETTEKSVVFADSGKQYNLYYDGLWNIKETFDVNEIKSDVFKMIDDLQKDVNGLEIFGQLISGIKNYVKLVKNQLNSTYYINLYIGDNKLESVGSIDEIKNEVISFFDNELSTNSSFYGWMAESVNFEVELKIHLTGNANYDTNIAEKQLNYWKDKDDFETLIYWQNELSRRLRTKSIIDGIISKYSNSIKTNKDFLELKNRIDAELNKVQRWCDVVDDYVLITN